RDINEKWAGYERGIIQQIIGPIVDCKFEESMPQIGHALEAVLPMREGERNVFEVVQHLGGGLVRCISISPAEGLFVGKEVVATGGPITTPVGRCTLGRILNVLGDPIDGL